MKNKPDTHKMMLVRSTHQIMIWMPFIKNCIHKKTEPHKMPKILQICGIFCVKEH
ncbi:MAG: hypothetical protein ACLUP2_07330 [Lachnospiraceae bacterium]